MKSEWNTSAIANICKVVTDGSHTSPKSVSHGKYMVSVKDFTPYGFDFNGCRQISFADYEKLKSSGCVPQKGDILIGKDGARYFEDIIIYNQDEAPALLSSIAILRCDEEKVIPEYLYYLLKTPSFKKDVKDNYGSGSAIPRIILKDFKRMKVEYPSIEKQRQIVSILHDLDAKIFNNQKVNDNLQQQLFSLYENMATASPCLKEYTLSNLCDFQEGYVNPPQTHPEYFDGEVKWLRAVDINESFIIETSRTLTKAGFESAKKSALLFEPNTIAISKSGTIGRLGIIADYMCGNRAVINIAPHDTNMLAFIYCFLKSKQREFPDMAVGSVQKNLYVSLLEPLSVSIPDNESLTAFNAVGASILGMIHNNCVENTDLANLRDTILPKLMSGEIDVSSVLL